MKQGWRRHLRMEPSRNLVMSARVTPYEAYFLEKAANLCESTKSSVIENAIRHYVWMILSVNGAPRDEIEAVWMDILEDLNKESYDFLERCRSQASRP